MFKIKYQKKPQPVNNLGIYEGVIFRTQSDPKAYYKICKPVLHTNTKGIKDIWYSLQIATDNYRELVTKYSEKNITDNLYSGTWIKVENYVKEQSK